MLCIVNTINGRRKGGFSSSLLSFPKKSWGEKIEDRKHPCLFWKHRTQEKDPQSHSFFRPSVKLKKHFYLSLHL